MIWLHGRERSDKFLLALNSYHESIKFTWEIGYEKVSFLDMMISANGGKLILIFIINRRIHIAIPNSQALRLKRICD